MLVPPSSFTNDSLISGRMKKKMARGCLYCSLGLLRTEISEFHCCLPDGRRCLSEGWAYEKRWRFEGREAGGGTMRRRGALARGGKGWHRGVVRFISDIDIGLTLQFELEVGFEAESEKRAMASCESIGNLLFWV
jgi:hypothetical protein